MRCKQGRLPRRREINSRAVIDHQPVHHLRMIQCQLHHNPPAHRPPANVRARNMHSLHKLHHYRLLHRDRIAHVRSRRPPVPQQVRRIHMKSLRRERRNHRTPILTPRTQPMHQHQRHSCNTLWRQRLKIVDPIAVHHRVLALHTLSPQPKTNLLIANPQRMKIKNPPGYNNEHHHHREHPQNKLHSDSPHPLAAILLQRLAELFPKHRMSYIKAAAVVLIGPLRVPDSQQRHHPVAQRQP